MPNETTSNKMLTKTLPYLTAGALACLFFIKNTGFFRYAFEPGIITHIWMGTLLSNIIITPVQLAVFSAVIWYLGNRTLFLLKADETAGEYRMVFSFVLGTGVLNLILIGFGVAGLLTPLFIKTFIILLFVAALIKIVKEYENAGTVLAETKPPEYMGRAVTVLICYVLFCGIISALSPPSSWDSLSYHLPIAKQYLEAERIFLIPYLVMHQCGIGMEMLTTAALGFNNDVLAQLLPLVSFAVTLRIIYIFVKTRVSRTAGSIAAALFAALPMSMYMMGKVTNDYHLAMFSIAAVVSLIEFKKTGHKGLLAFMLFSTGFAVNSKLSGLITALLVILVVVYWVINKTIHIKNAALPILIFALISSVTLARNYIFTGNPVFPMFYDSLGGKGMTKQNYERKRVNNIETTSLKPNIKNYLLLPYHLIKDSGRFQNQPRYFVVAFIILLLIRLASKRKPEEEEIYLLYFTLGFMSIWFFSGIHIWRFMMPALASAIILTIQWGSKISGTVLKIIVGAAIMLNLLPIIGLSVNNNLFEVCALPSKISPERSPRENYLLKTLDNYGAFEFVNENTRKDAKILLFRELRGYYLDRRYMLGDPLMQDEIRYEEIEGADELAIALKEHGVTHILINFNIYPPSPYYYDERINGLMQKFTESKCKIVHESNRVVLYEIKS